MCRRSWRSALNLKARVWIKLFSRAAAQKRESVTETRQPRVKRYFLVKNCASNSLISARSVTIQPALQAQTAKPSCDCNEMASRFNPHKNFKEKMQSTLSQTRFRIADKTWTSRANMETAQPSGISEWNWSGLKPLFPFISLFLVVSPPPQPGCAVR